MHNPYDQYRRVATETADPLELVLMLYRGAITALHGAEQALERGEIERSHQALIRAQSIVAELMGTLNLDAGEVAHNLHRLYDYMQRRLMEANLRKQPEGAVEVRRLLSQLLETWEELAQRQRAAAVAAPMRFAGALGVA